MKKQWMVVGVVVGVFAVTALGGVALAQTPTPEAQATVPPTASAHKSYTARLAEELGVSEQALTDAMKSVRREAQNERAVQLLDRLVAAGKITREQADEYLAWWTSRPESLPIGLGGPGGVWGKHVRPYFAQGEMQRPDRPMRPEGAFFGRGDTGFRLDEPGRPHPFQWQAPERRVAVGAPA